MAGVKGRSGRKPKSYHRQQTEMIIAEGSPKAIRYLMDIAEGKTKPVFLRMEACKYIVNHDIGLPKARAEIFNTDKLSVWTELIGDNRDSESGLDTEKPAES